MINFTRERLFMYVVYFLYILKPAECLIPQFLHFSIIQTPDPRCSLFSAVNSVEISTSVCSCPCSQFGHHVEVISTIEKEGGVPSITYVQ